MTCPCCRGTGKTRRVTGPKGNGTDSWQVQEAPCLFCQQPQAWEWANVQRLAVKVEKKAEQGRLL